MFAIRRDIAYRNKDSVFDDGCDQTESSIKYDMIFRYSGVKNELNSMQIESKFNFRSKVKEALTESIKEWYYSAEENLPLPTTRPQRIKNYSMLVKIIKKVSHFNRLSIFLLSGKKFGI